MSKPIKVVVAIERTLLRESIEMALGADKEINVAGEASSLTKAIELAREIKPSVLLLSIEVLDADSCKDMQSSLCRLNEVSPASRILILVTGEIDYTNLVCAVKSGAMGYLSIDKGLDHLLDAIKKVNKGEMWVERKLIPELIHQQEANNNADDPCAKAKELGITKREKQVLDCLQKGLCNKEIADRLFISQKTVKTHLTNIFRKLKVADRLQAILLSIERGV